MRVFRASCLAGLVSLALCIPSFIGSANASTITLDFTGTLASVTDTNGVLAANNPSLLVGTPFQLAWTYDNSVGPTFLHTYDANNGDASWWGDSHSSMVLTIGGSSWGTVGSQRVDVFANIPSPPFTAPTQQMDSTFLGPMTTDVAPSFNPTNSLMDMEWFLVNGVSAVDMNTGFPDNYSWTYDPASTIFQTGLGLHDFPTSIDMSNWELGFMTLDVSQTGSGRSIHQLCPLWKHHWSVICSRTQFSKSVRHRIGNDGAGARRHSEDRQKSGIVLSAP